MKRITRTPVTKTSAERLNDVCMSDADRAWARAYLAGIETVVDFVWKVAANIGRLADVRTQKPAYTRTA